jgi:phosphotransferase system HPr (HPr) family protein
MIEREYIIVSLDGMHARPATALIRIIRKFKSVVNVKKGDQLVRLNSMLNILSMSAKAGQSIAVVIEGEDELDAASAIDLFFKEELSKY